MERLAIDNESRNRLDPGTFCFAEPIFLIAKVDYFYFKSLRVKGLSDEPFRLDTNRATRVIEYCFS